jgi:hypothetical protein
VTGKWRNPVRIADAVTATFSRLGLEPRLREHAIFRVWPAVVGQAIARHAAPESLRNARLLIHVTDPIWLHHLSMMRHRILEALRVRLGPSAVRELVLRIGEVSPPPSPSAAPAGERAAPPDAARLAEIEAIVAPVKDDEAREAFRRLLLRRERAGR